MLVDVSLSSTSISRVSSKLWKLKIVFNWDFFSFLTTTIYVKINDKTRSYLFAMFAPNWWNKLSFDIKTAESLHIFNAD